VNTFISLILGALLGIAGLALALALGPSNHISTKLSIDQSTMQVVKCSSPDQTLVSCEQGCPNGVYSIEWVRGVLR